MTHLWLMDSTKQQPSDGRDASDITAATSSQQDQGLPDAISVGIDLNCKTIVLKVVKPRKVAKTDLDHNKVIQGGRSHNEVLLHNVPTSVSMPDLLQFLAPARGCIRMILELKAPSSTSLYMVLLEFRTNENAFAFVKSYKGRPYSFLEPESCVPVLVSGQGLRSLLQIPAAECPICLEVADPAKGDVAILLCQHIYHAECLSKCLELKCAVCRYVHRSADNNTCSDCDATEGLWMCLSCGYIGCGRQQWRGDGSMAASHSHALHHYTRSGHAYAQNIETQQVWDYANDRYCQLLGEDATQRKLGEVQLPGTDEAGPGKLSEQDAQAGLTLEYLHILTSQLEQHRRMYSDRQTESERHCRQWVQRREGDLQKATDRRNELLHEIEACAKSVNITNKEARRLATATETANRKQTEEQAVVDSMEVNVPLWEQKLAAVEAKHFSRITKKKEVCTALQEQLADLFTQLDQT